MQCENAKNLAALEQFLEQNKKAAIAFSGGCDSAFLLAAAAKKAVDVQPYFIKGDFQPQFELEDAKRLCRELNVPLKVLRAQPLQEKEIAENGPQRCYYCKKMIFTKLMAAALQDGYSVLWDGTNASDAEDDRPGMKALKELQVQSPLRIAGLTKQQIRAESQKMGLFTWNKPAYACLATRIATGTRLTQEDLMRVENAEKALFQMGFSNLRIRVMENAGKLQLPQSQMAKAADMQDRIVDTLKPWFSDVLLDLKARPEET